MASMSGRRIVVAVSGAFTSALVTVGLLIAVVLLLAVSRGGRYELPHLVAASGGTGADLGSMTVDAAGALAWTAGLFVVFAAMGVGLARRSR